eukprot:4200768-Alexandrium_andersonii.AAC.1
MLVPQLVGVVVGRVLCAIVRFPALAFRVPALGDRLKACRPAVASPNEGPVSYTHLTLPTICSV